MTTTFKAPRAMTRLFAAASMIALGACGEFDLPNVDNASINALEQDPTPSVIAASVQGLINGIRSSTQDNLSRFAHYGREGYYIDVAQTRLTAFDDVLTPAAEGVGNSWSNTYQYVRLGNSILHALDVVSGMTDPQKEGIRGFVKTAEVYFLHGQLRASDDFGIVVDTDHPRTDPLPPQVGKAAAFTYLNQRLDEAKTHLLAAGTTFGGAFALSPGFTGFNTPANFLKVNRALKARVAIENADYAGALAALAESFIDPAAAMSLGAYNSFSTISGDQTNQFFDPSGFSYVADSFLVQEAQNQPGGAKDARVTNKTTYIRDAAGAIITRTHTNVTSNLRWTVYPTSTSPIPIIKNEELLLIRAEALWRTGDRAGALVDINTVRTVSGGLAALGADPGDPGLENELLYNRRYSLLLEYGHRWIDLRRFGRLNDPTQLHGPRGANDLIFDRLPWPQAECDARAGGTLPPGCSQVNGTRTTS